jgi:hypothetical protein
LAISNPSECVVPLKLMLAYRAQLLRQAFVSLNASVEEGV